MSIDLECAKSIIAAAAAKGATMQFKPLTVAVLDVGANIIALERQDGASNLRPHIAIGKAAGALALGISSRKIAETAARYPAFVASLHTISQEGIIPAAGGILVFSQAGALLGAVGVTGDTAENDEVCAFAGVESVNLCTQK